MQSDEKQPCHFDDGNFCKALREKKCTGCSFYKTDAEYEDGIAKAKRKLSARYLIPAQRIRIRNGDYVLCMTAMKNPYLDYEI